MKKEYDSLFFRIPKNKEVDYIAQFQNALHIKLRSKLKGKINLLKIKRLKDGIKNN